MLRRGESILFAGTHSVLRVCASCAGALGAGWVQRCSRLPAGHAKASMVLVGTVARSSRLQKIWRVTRGLLHTKKLGVDGKAGSSIAMMTCVHGGMLRAMVAHR